MRRKRRGPSPTPETRKRYLSVKERRPAVMRLRLQGYTPGEIAIKLQIPEKTALADIRLLMSKQEDPDTISERVLQADRIESLHTVVSEHLESSDPDISLKAVNAATKLLKRKADLLGLDKPKQVDLNVETDWDELLS